MRASPWRWFDQTLLLLSHLGSLSLACSLCYSSLPSPWGAVKQHHQGTECSLCARHSSQSFPALNAFNLP